MKFIRDKMFAGVKDRCMMSLPPVVSSDSIHEHQRRALIGWIAARMASALHMDKQGSDSIIFLSLSLSRSPEKNDDECQTFFNLASCLVEWVEQEEDVYLNARELRLPDRNHRSLLETYEEIKADLPRYLLPKKKNEQDARPSENDAIWQVYRDVIFAASQQKFLLIRKHEIERYKKGNVLCSIRISERSDIPAARELAKEKLKESDVPDIALMSHLLVISEAITNVLKHAQEGQMTIVQTDTTLNVLVEDKGPGFPLKLLPNTTLMAGYSTKKSLGQGFTLMMKMTEQVLLSTVPGEGSAIILIFKREGVERVDAKHF